MGVQRYARSSRPAVNGTKDGSPHRSMPSSSRGSRESGAPPLAPRRQGGRLIRRATFDLNGPAAAAREVETFVADSVGRCLAAVVVEFACCTPSTATAGAALVDVCPLCRTKGYLQSGAALSYSTPTATLRIRAFSTRNGLRRFLTRDRGDKLDLGRPSALAASVLDRRPPPPRDVNEITTTGSTSWRGAPD